ncbi:RGCVC family protein [Jatrophihabitans sp.]|uniref:RGCVC family protein n=1 Tax=Jatrophihabitans sp. TaxID=1932789 RepID=UPI0030C6A68F|nr:hypothetical protein [Jatrophihabitans sp.]
MTDVQPVETTTETPAETPGTCSCCEHAESAHDEKALRYCQATQLRALTRGCICG